MADGVITYLCGGTFFAQVVRAKISSTTPADHIDGKKESLPEQEVFRRLISIYQLKDFGAYAGGSLKTNASNFKSCKDTCESFALFSDNDMKRAFEEDVRSSKKVALAMMSKFVRDCIDPEKYVQLVRCLLDMIQSDAENLNDTIFFALSDAEPITGKELCVMDTIVIEPFLLGIWYFIIMQRSGDNQKGATTYRQWYPSGKVYIGKIGNGITREIFVKSAPTEYAENFDKNGSDDDIPAVEMVSYDEGSPKEDADSIPKSDGENVKTVNQTIEHATIVNQYGEKNIHIDHVDTLNL